MTKSCITFSLAARLIGAFGITISTLMMNILVSEYLSTKEDDTFFYLVDSWSIFGMNWTVLVKNSRSYKPAQFLFICILVYAMCSLIANALLSFASITRKPQFALPWMYLQVISIIDQTIAIAVHFSCIDFEVCKKSVWYIPFSNTYLLLSAYFLFVVCAARKEWADSPRTDIYISTITRSYEVPQGSNMPKSPSYLAEQTFFTNSQKSTISSKYEQV